MTQILIAARCGKKTMHFRSLVLAASLVLIFPGNVKAGNPDSTAPPDSTFSLSLEDLYLRLTTGASGTPIAFTEPTAAPGAGTMHTIDEIMAAAPTPDNANGALPGDVMIGRTFWGLRTDGTWGLQTGTWDPNADNDSDGLPNCGDACPDLGDDSFPVRVGDLCWNMMGGCSRVISLTDSDGDGCHEGYSGRGDTGCDASTPYCFSPP